MKNPFVGVFTALVTPFRDGRLDLPALDALVDRQLAAGVAGLVPCGTTGESPTLSDDEQQAVIARVAARAGGRAQVLAGAGSNSTAHAVHLARRAADAGADGLLVVSPYYNKPTQEGLCLHFAAVADAVPLPIMLYNIPGRCGVEITVPTLRRLRESNPRIVAVKHATGRVDDAAELAAACDLAILSGDDPLTLPLMSLGAVGVVSVLSNLAPRAVNSLVRAALASDFAAARTAHAAVYPLARALLALATNPIPIKTALAIRGLVREEFRPPMCGLTDAQRDTLRRLLAEHGALEE